MRRERQHAAIRQQVEGCEGNVRERHRNEKADRDDQDRLRKLSVSFRKSTGIESTLEKLDKLIPNNLQNPVGPKLEKEIGRAVADLEEAAGSYGDQLSATIAEQKAQFGKGTDSLYRDLKILRASLESAVADAKRDLAKLVAAREIAQGEVEAELKASSKPSKQSGNHWMRPSRSGRSPLRVS
jgi:hypothetical protein